MILLDYLCRPRELCCGDEMFRGRRIAILATGATENERRGRGRERTNFQSWAGQTIEVLMNQSHAPARLDGRDEAGGAVVLFGNLRRRRRSTASGGVPFVGQLTI